MLVVACVFRKRYKTDQSSRDFKGDPEELFRISIYSLVGIKITISPLILRAFWIKERRNTQTVHSVPLL